jgi:uncharacterized surface protein with fasciclin (FAS1) repeats
MVLLKLLVSCIVLLACTAEGAEPPVAAANAPGISITYNRFPGCTFFQDTLVERDEDFSTLKAALAATQLNDTLATLQQPITVFAPTNEAFDKAAALLNTTLPALLVNPGLRSLLLYHASPVVVPELSQFYTGQSLNTLQGGTDNLTALVVNNTVGIMAFGSEGVLLEGYAQACQIAYYVIDEVLLPESFLFANDTLYYYLANSLLSNATLVPTTVVTTAVSRGLTFEVAAALVDAQFNGASSAVTGLCRSVALANVTNTNVQPATAILESLAQNFTCADVAPCARGVYGGQALNFASQAFNYSSALRSCLTGLFNPPAPAPAPIRPEPAATPAATTAATTAPTPAATQATTSPSASTYVVNGPQGPCSCTLGPAGSYNPAMTNPTLTEALIALGPTKCPTQPDGNIGVGNSGGNGNIGCYNTGTGNAGDNNTGTGNKGAGNSGTGNVGFGSSGMGQAVQPPPTAPPPSPAQRLVAAQPGYVVNGPQGPCACTLGPPGSYDPKMQNPTLAQALNALGPDKCPQGPNGNVGVGNTGGSGNTGCYNTGTANTGDNNSGDANTGAGNNGNANVGFCLTGSSLTGQPSTSTATCSNTATSG